jgi:hypothetical protein
MTSSEDKDFESEILFNLIKENYGCRLNEEQLENIKNNVKKIVQTSKELRKEKLGNWDEPFSVFIPFRKEQK